MRSRLIEVADDGAAHHHAGGAAERLKEARGDQLRQGLGEDAAALATTIRPRPASSTGRRPKRSDSGPMMICEQAMPTM